MPRAQRIPNAALRSQAIESMTTKRFHCEGGAVYSTGLIYPEPVIAAIVAVQTISDYLDTVVDRGPSKSGEDYRRLHNAMLDALDTGPLRGGYYDLHPNKDDGGYLASLVTASRKALAYLPGYAKVSAECVRLAGLYNDLQEFKHLKPKAVGEAALHEWYEKHRLPGIDWWEFAASCGSTLGIFALVRMAAGGTPPRYEVDALLDAYVPSICGLHILLDYYIDQAEDVQVDEINLVSYYPNETVRCDRLQYFARRAAEAAGRLPDAEFHRWVAAGLPGLYLADPKVAGQGLEASADKIVRSAGPWAKATLRFSALRHRLHR